MDESAENDDASHHSVTSDAIEMIEISARQEVQTLVRTDYRTPPWQLGPLPKDWMELAIWHKYQSDAGISLHELKYLVSNFSDVNSELLNKILQEGCDGTMFAVAASRLSPDTTTLSLGRKETYDSCYFGNQHVAAMPFYCLVSLKLFLDNYTPSAWLLLMRSVPSCKSLRFLGLGIPKATMDLDPQSAGLCALKICFGTLALSTELEIEVACMNTSRKGFYPGLLPAITTQHQICAQCILEGLQGNQSRVAPLKSLVFEFFRWFDFSLMDIVGQLTTSFSMRGAHAVSTRNVMKVTTQQQDVDLWNNFLHSLRGSRFHFDVKYGERKHESSINMNTPVGKTNQLTSLKLRYETESSSDIDCTSMLVAILRHKHLENFDIECEGYTKQNIAASRTADCSLVCKALAANTSLRKLSIGGIKFVETSFANIPCLFANAFETNSGVTFCNIDIWASQIPGNSFLCAHCTDKANHLLRLNNFGRRRMRDKTMTLADLTKHLSAVNEASYFTPKAVLQNHLQALDDTNRSSKHQIDMYIHLRASVGTGLGWSYVASGQHHIETTRLLYGLLREAPDCWCVTGTLASPTKRKRKRDNE